MYALGSQTPALDDDDRIHVDNVLRKGPNDKQPVMLYEQVSTGRVGMNLRDDGLLLVQPVGFPPRLYFPDTKEPVEVEPPPPQRWDVYLTSPDMAYRDLGRTWFLGDCLLYSRMAFPGHLLIGFLRIDLGKKAVAESKLCLEVVDKDQAVAYAAEVMPVVFRAGDYVFWVNKGYHSRFTRELLASGSHARCVH